MARGRHSNRTQPLPSDWRPSTRPRILKRDGNACQWPDGNGNGNVCGAYAYRVDHKQPAHLGGTDDDDNLWSLCDRHTRIKDATEGGKAAAAQRLLRKRPTEQHPGLID